MSASQRRIAALEESVAELTALLLAEQADKKYLEELLSSLIVALDELAKFIYSGAPAEEILANIQKKADEVFGK